MMDAQSCKQRKQRITRMLAWGKNGGVMIIGYEMLRTIIQVALRTEVKCEHHSIAYTRTISD